MSPFLPAPFLNQTDTDTTSQPTLAQEVMEERKEGATTTFTASPHLLQAPRTMLGSSTSLYKGLNGTTTTVFPPPLPQCVFFPPCLTAKEIASAHAPTLVKSSLSLSFLRFCVMYPGVSTLSQGPQPSETQTTGKEVRETRAKEGGEGEAGREMCQNKVTSFSLTHQSVLVRDVVGELELVERDDLLHPLLSGGRAVRVDVHALRHLRIGLASHDPPAANE